MSAEVTWMEKTWEQNFNCTVGPSLYNSFSHISHRKIFLKGLEIKKSINQNTFKLEETPLAKTYVVKKRSLKKLSM